MIYLQIKNEQINYHQKILIGLVIALSLSCGTLMKFFLYYNISHEKLSDRPINVLILIEQIMHHIFYMAIGMIVLAKVKLRCDERLTHAFTACSCVFNEIISVDSNQGNYFENTTACSKTLVATQLMIR
jgi:hypothetical protein